MIIQVNVKPPLSVLFGMSETNLPKVLQMSINSGSSFEELLKRIGLRYPKFQSFMDSKNNRLGDILIVVDGAVITSAELDQINLHDKSIVSFLVQYRGG